MRYRVQTCVFGKVRRRSLLQILDGTLKDRKYYVSVNPDVL